MSSVLLFALLGLGGGAVIALLALGVVGEHKASGVVNFAHGATAMFCAYCFTQLRSTGDLVLPVVVLPHRVPLAGHGLGTAPAMLITVVYGALFGVVVYLGIFRWLRGAPALAKVVASIGLMLTVQALAVIDFGTAARPSARVLPTDTVTLFGATVSRDRLVLAGIAVVAALGLAAFYRFTRFGIVTRAVADPANYADPVPQAMVLTAIVITLGMTAFLLAMAYRSWQLHRHDEVQDDVEDRRIARLAARDLRAVTDDDTELFTQTLDDDAAEARDETDRGAV